MTLRILSDRHTLAAEQPNTRPIVMRITAPSVAKSAEQTPICIAFALDTSGSMNGHRIELSRLAIQNACGFLGAQDSAALSTFSEHAQTIMPLRKTDDIGKEILGHRLSITEAGGTTNLFAGWVYASDELLEAKGEIARVILLTDGHANRGECQVGVICESVARAASRGIRTSVFGVGEDYDDDLLQAVSAAGHGNFYYVSTDEEIPEFMAQELKETREISARSVTLEFELPPGVELQELNEWAVRVDGNFATMPLPDLVSNQVLEIGLRLKFQAMADQERIRIGVKLKSAEGLLGHDELVYEVGDDSNQAINEELVKIIANLRFQQATREAVREHRAGRRGKAGRLLDQLCLDLRKEGIDEERFPEIFESISKQAERMRKEFSEKERKTISHSATMSIRTRTPSSSPRRRED